MRYYEYPLKVNGERVWRTWLGGRELDKMHGVAEPKDGYFPEEWMLSTTRARNVGREDIEEGLCYLADVPERISLKQLIESHPAEMLGAAHAAKHDNAQGVLVKLIDSQVRLAIQVHPDKDAAGRLFNSPFGKTECWHVLGLRHGEEGADPCIYLGFREGITRERLEDCFARQDREGMLALLNRIVPVPGETYIVHGGVPHAIGAGCFIVEIQEPTDYTIRLEKVMPYGLILDDMALHQGLGFQRMFDCFHYDGKSIAAAAAEWRLPGRTLGETDEWCEESLVDYGVTPCFAMNRLTVSGRMPMPRRDVFSGLYVVSGSGHIECEGGRAELRPNDQFFIPGCCRDFVLVNDAQAAAAPLRLLRFFGPKAC